jgi:D-3-phosphoglycerate dehydrogenase
MYLSENAMSKPIVVCLEPLSKGMKNYLREELQNQCNLHFFDTVEEGESLLPEAECLIVFTKGITKELIIKASKCKIVQKLGAGFDKIDRNQLNEQNIYLTVTKGVNSRSVAEHALLLMMATYKRLITAHNALLAGSWHKTALRDFSYELSGKTIGLIGLGSIGKELCQLLRGFDVDIRYFDIFPVSSEEEITLGVKYCRMEDIIPLADVISLHVALTDKTRNLVNREFLDRAKRTAIIINTCRGEVIDESALYDALKNFKILGAALDVFTTEPLPSDSPLRGLENVILTPHIGGGTIDAMKRVTKIAASNIKGALFGEGPECVNIVKYEV